MKFYLQWYSSEHLKQGKIMSKWGAVQCERACKARDKSFEIEKALKQPKYLEIIFMHKHLKTRGLKIIKRTEATKINSANSDWKFDVKFLS